MDTFDPQQPPLSEETVEDLVEKIKWYEQKIALERDPGEKKHLREKEHQLREKENLKLRLELAKPQSSDKFGDQPPAKRTCCAYSTSIKVPSALNISASAATSQPQKYIHPTRVEVPLFSHWFATDVYNVYFSNPCLTAINGNIMLSIDNQSYLLQMDTLTKCAQNFNSIALFCSNQTNKQSFLSDNARNHENTFSSLITPVLTKLLGTENGNFFNQLVIRVRGNDNRQSDKPDHIAATMVDGIPTVCALVSDCKKVKMDDGKNQVHAYGLALESTFLFLGLTITHTNVCLELFIPFNGKLSVIEICRANCADVNDLKRFFCTLYIALRSLLDNPIPATSQHQITLKCCGEKLLCLYGDKCSHINLGHTQYKFKGSVVVHCTRTNKVRKYYDKMYHFLPTEEGIAFIPNAQLLCPLESRYQILEYPYMIGCHTLKTSLQVAAAVRELQKFHAKDLVHGDIRSINMIVSEDTVNFIDVDFTRKEGSKYPGTYNHSEIPERHRDAIKYSAMKKLHDRYSLYQIIKTYFVSDNDENDELHKAVKELLDMDILLETIATKIVALVEAVQESLENTDHMDT